MNTQELFHETTQRQPEDLELFVQDGHVHVYHRETRVWEDLGESSEEGIVPEVGSLQFELQNGIIAEGSPAFILRLILRAFYRIPDTRAREFADTAFNIFRECGWKGPIESENENVGGSIVLEAVGLTAKYHVDDLRIVMAQMQDPNFNGWLQFETEGEVQFIQTGHMRRIKVKKREDDSPNES